MAFQKRGAFLASGTGLLEWSREDGKCLPQMSQTPSVGSSLDKAQGSHRIAVAFAQA